MPMFVDRVQEMKTMEQEYRKERASFVVIYGRRRLGKTTLISEFCKGKRVISFLATEESEAQNLGSFQRLVAETLDDALLKDVKMERWEPVFDAICRSLPQGERLVIVFDEFQYLGKANPAFPSVFMRIWDEKLKDQNVMVILCGSLMRMMQSQVLNYDSPLYGRRTAQIRMLQIPFSYYKEFAPDKSEEERILQYAVTGGVPKYIELFESSGSVYDAIEAQIANPNAFLYAEPEFLLQKEVSEIGSYFSLLKIIASGAHKLSEIASRMGVPQSGLTRYLKTLEELDILERETPITEENPAKSKMGQYIIRDHFIRFWFRFIYPYRGQIETGNMAYVRELLQNHFIEHHVSFVYEAICREQIWQMTDVLPAVDRVGRWWNNRDAEIDIVAYQSDGDAMVFGECKFSASKKDVDLLGDLRAKAANVKWKQGSREEYFVIFSKAGFTKRLQDMAKADSHIVLRTVGQN